MSNIFNGGWSYTNLEMSALFKFIDPNKNYDSFNILEFGGGDSSIKILKLFKNVKNLSYTIFETNSIFLPSEKELFNINLYDENELEKLNLNDYISNNIKFDLILVDGPNGEKRKYWYNKIKTFIKTDTILLADDFNHYSSFSEELDKNFDYETLSFSNIPFEPYGEHSWKIVKIKNVKN
jgi:hypothetical protein